MQQVTTLRSTLDSGLRLATPLDCAPVLQHLHCRKQVDQGAPS
jgi:hypothetical protein